MNNAIVMLEVAIKEESTAIFLDLLSKYLPETRAYDGFISINIHQCTSENTFVLYQEWTSIQHYEAYLQWRTDTGVMDILGNTFAAEAKIRYWNIVEPI